jgi:hypothetical protein
MKSMLRIALPLACVVPSACAFAPQPDELVGKNAAAIMGGEPATAYPEAVVVTSSGFIPCSGVVLAPRVVLSAGHCRSATKSYAVLAPNADGQTASGSSDWTTFNGNAATSSDTLLIFLDTPITLASYPVIGGAEVAAGTSVVDVGRTLNGAITMNDYYSPPVTIEGPATPLGFRFNYEATPDISEDGDSGGPIEVPGSSPHLVVAIVDTDTIEQNITDAGASPIDLFARLDVVHDEILAQIASHGDGGAPHVDAGEDASRSEHDAGAKPRDAAADLAPPPARGGSCTLTRAPDVNQLHWSFVALVPLALYRRRRAHAS